MPANLHSRGKDSETPGMTPEQQAREKIDAQILASGWAVQNCTKIDFSAGRGIALRKVPLKSILQKAFTGKLLTADSADNTDGKAYYPRHPRNPRSISFLCLTKK